MYELLWFVGGALTYKILTRILQITQTFLFFQEIHMHALIMLDAISKDLEEAKKIKLNLIKDAISQEEIKLITFIDGEVINIWKESAVNNMRLFVPEAFQSAIEYKTWDELIKHLHTTKKRNDK